MNNYQYLTSMVAEGNSKTFFIILAFIICVVALYIYFRFFATGEEEYIEVESEDENGELYIPEDTKYRADWLTVLMNYVILSYGKMSDEPKISAFKPADGVSVLRITDQRVQFNITVYWFKHKVVLTGFVMPIEGYGDIQTVKYGFKWKGYEVPYIEVDKFLAKFMNVEEKLMLDKIAENLSQKEVNKLLIQELIHMAVDEEFVFPEDDSMDLMVAVVYGLLRLIPKLKKDALNEYLAFLSILITTFAKDYGADWLQKFSFEQEVIDDLLKQINDDGAAQTAEEEEEKED